MGETSPCDVLIVDDDDALRDSLSDLLSNYGLSVRQAVSGVDALSVLLDGLRPGVTLLDCRMPYMGGRTLLAAMLASHELRDLLVVLMTGEDTFSDDVVATLRKPVAVPVLMQTIWPLVRGERWSK